MPSLFVSNISYDVNLEILYELFVQFVHPLDIQYSNKVAFIECKTDADILKAINKLGSIKLYGRRIKIERIEENTKIEIWMGKNKKKEYIASILRRYGPCRIIRQTKERRWICEYRKRADAEQANRKLNNKEVLGEIFTVRIIN